MGLLTKFYAAWDLGLLAGFVRTKRLIAVVDNTPGNYICDYNQ